MPDTLKMLKPMTHTEPRSYQCPICGTWLAERIELNHHAWREHSGVGRSYRCSECGQVFASQKRLWNHRSRVHPVE